tara:strand:+ start:89727 stop:90749 length:1023 start_codon:yes stop_codon:yes gene_type:complete
MTVPSSVLDAYGFSADDIESVTGGLINQTYRVRGGNGQALAALQRLHPIFAGEVNLDLDAVTQKLAAMGMPTPRLLRTQSGKPWVEQDEAVWRCISWVEGECYAKLPTPEFARAGAELVGRFHRALDGFDYTFAFTRSGVHDTPAHFAKLREIDTKNFTEQKRAEQLRESIFDQAHLLPTMPKLPLRICHGDLKISNLLFDKVGKGLCLIDLDTMGSQTIAYELGDALRSWANRNGEDADSAGIDLNVVSQTALGYATGSEGLLNATEIGSVIVGLETICLELAARFCHDIFSDSYFGWDAERYESRRAHNLVRAQGQLALCRSVALQRSELQSAWTSAF